MARSPAIPDRREAFPDEAFINDIGILGKKGSGKTTTAKGFAEQLLNAGKRICALDPTGVWWGLRLLADGKTPGYPVVIFGGSHADVPIEEGSGTRLAEIVAGGTFSWVWAPELDVLAKMDFPRIKTFDSHAGRWRACYGTSGPQRHRHRRAARRPRGRGDGCVSRSQSCRSFTRPAGSGRKARL